MQHAARRTQLQPKGNREHQQNVGRKKNSIKLQRAIRELQIVIVPPFQPFELVSGELSHRVEFEV